MEIKKIFYLSSCDTCKRIIVDLELKEKKFIFQDIKTEKITEVQLNELKELSGSYEVLFSRVARKYKELELGLKQLTEEDYRKLIFEEYTFLKRPVVVVNNKIFIGNTKQTLENLKKEL